MSYLGLIFLVALALAAATPARATDNCAADPAIWSTRPVLLRSTRIFAQARLRIVAIGSSCIDGIDGIGAFSHAAADPGSRSMQLFLGASHQHSAKLH